MTIGRGFDVSARAAESASCETITIRAPSGDQT